MAAGKPWRGHVPVPNGLPGGYPVRLEKGRLTLDLPAAVSEAEAIRWNASFEEANGLVVAADGTARFTGILGDRLALQLPALGQGFRVDELEAVCAEMLAVRDRLIDQP